MTTEFKEGTTVHLANPNGVTPTLMSKEGAALASITAPNSALVVSNKSTAAVKEK